jgi:hypothetical protein
MKSSEIVNKEPHPKEPGTFLSPKIVETDEGAGMSPLP